MWLSFFCGSTFDKTKAWRKFGASPILYSIRHAQTPPKPYRSDSSDFKQIHASSLLHRLHPIGQSVIHAIRNALVCADEAEHVNTEDISFPMNEQPTLLET